MATLIKKFNDGSVLEFDQGAFDSWCVYLTRPNANRYPPRDIEYFNEFVQLGERYGYEKIYKDFVRIYEKTNANVDVEVLELISKLAEDYSSDKQDIEILFVIVYAGMVAEENKMYAVLKKKIKRLGMHQLLIEKFEPKVATNYSRGKKAGVINEECKERGF